MVKSREFKKLGNNKAMMSFHRYFNFVFLSLLHTLHIFELSCVTNSSFRFQNWEPRGVVLDAFLVGLSLASLTPASSMWTHREGFGEFFLKTLDKSIIYFSRRSWPLTRISENKQKIDVNVWPKVNSCSTCIKFVRVFYVLLGNSSLRIDRHSFTY